MTVVVCRREIVGLKDVKNTFDDFAPLSDAGQIDDDIPPIRTRLLLNGLKYYGEPINKSICYCMYGL